MRTDFLFALCLISAQAGWSQVPMTLGTTMNETGSFELTIGGWTNVADSASFFPRIGGYGIVGFGEGDYAMTGARYYSNITSGQANGWGDPVIGYQSAGGLNYFGAGLLFGINEPKDESGSLHFIMVGFERGNDGPIQEVRSDPTGILGGGTYAIDSTKEPTSYNATRIQYLADFSSFLVGFGYILGTHPGVTFHVGFDFGLM